jgi:hypothetical protein
MIFPYENDPLATVLFTTAAHNRGILPIHIGRERNDSNRDLEGYDPVAARKMKRKFRKAWRKIAKAQVASGSQGESRSAHLHLGLGSPAPSRTQKRNRKARVMSQIREEVMKAKSLLHTTDP